MSELNDPLWAVISERGCEAVSLSYDEATKLLRRLEGENIHGTCIVTAEAACHLAPAKTEARHSTQQPSKTHSKT
ncbi:MAG: hypothetical protein H0X14_06340 [Acidobacteria bacterium]|nr:hypothetical protein [Acidobacteriota bacterium]